MSEPTLDDLRVFVRCDRCDMGNVADGHGGFDQCPDCSSTLTREATPAEFDRIATEQGYVKRPVCGGCDGAGEGDMRDGSHRLTDCPSCGGTGYGRLVALDDIDVEALRDAASQLGRHSIDTSADGSQVHVPPARLRRGGWSTIENTVWAVLAALDGGQE